MNGHEKGAESRLHLNNRRRVAEVGLTVDQVKPLVWMARTVHCTNECVIPVVLHRWQREMVFNNLTCDSLPLLPEKKKGLWKRFTS